MKLSKIWNELYNKLFPLYGMISVLFIIMEYITGTFGGRFAYELLVSYSFITIIHFLNSRIFAISMKGDKIIFYVVYIAETVVFVSVRRISKDLITHGQICYYSLFRAIGIVVIFMSVFSVITFFLVKTYTKRTNQKLEEYKQKNEDDSTEK